MTWLILIFWVQGSVSVEKVEFKNMRACKQALRYIEFEKDAMVFQGLRFRAICAPE